jgi:hypothetical protein
MGISAPVNCSVPIRENFLGSFSINENAGCVLRVNGGLIFGVILVKLNANCKRI